MLSGKLLVQSLWNAVQVSGSWVGTPYTGTAGEVSPILWHLTPLFQRPWWGWVNWSWSTSSPTAALGKSLLSSGKLGSERPSAVPAWAIALWMDSHLWSTDPQSVNLNPSDTPGWGVSQQLHFTSLGFREIPGQSLLIYIPKNLLHSYL